MTVSPCEFPARVLIICVLSAISRNYNVFFVLVLSPLIKSPYKTYFLNIPYFMRVRKLFDAEKMDEFLGFCRFPSGKMSTA